MMNLSVSPSHRHRNMSSYSSRNPNWRQQTETTIIENALTEQQNRVNSQSNFNNQFTQANLTMNTETPIILSPLSIVLHYTIPRQYDNSPPRHIYLPSSPHFSPPISTHQSSTTTSAHEIATFQLPPQANQHFIPVTEFNCNAFNPPNIDTTTGHRYHQATENSISDFISPPHSPLSPVDLPPQQITTNRVVKMQELEKLSEQGSILATLVLGRSATAALKQKYQQQLHANESKRHTTDKPVHPWFEHLHQQPNGCIRREMNTDFLKGFERQLAVKREIKQFNSTLSPSAPVFEPSTNVSTTISIPPENQTADVSDSIIGKASTDDNDCDSHNEKKAAEATESTSKATEDETAAELKTAELTELTAHERDSANNNSNNDASSLTSITPTETKPMHHPIATIAPNAKLTLKKHLSQTLLSRRGEKRTNLPNESVESFPSLTSVSHLLRSSSFSAPSPSSSNSSSSTCSAASPSPRSFHSTTSTSNSNDSPTSTNNDDKTAQRIEQNRKSNDTTQELQTIQAIQQDKLKTNTATKQQETSSSEEPNELKKQTESTTTEAKQTSITPPIKLSYAQVVRQSSPAKHSSKHNNNIDYINYNKTI